MSSGRAFTPPDMLPLAGLLLANILPIFAVLFFGWSLANILVLFWLESLVIGVVNLVRIMNSNGVLRQRISKSVFFIVHYGGFWVAHVLFLFMMILTKLDDSGSELATTASAMPIFNVRNMLLVMLLTHVLTLVLDLMKTKREERFTPTLQMFAPYGRVFILHFVILGGAYFLSEYASVLAVILMFGLLKLAYELLAYFLAPTFIAHNKEVTS